MPGAPLTFTRPGQRAATPPRPPARPPARSRTPAARARRHPQPRRRRVRPEPERGRLAQHPGRVGQVRQHDAAPRRDPRRPPARAVRDPAQPAPPSAARAERAAPRQKPRSSRTDCRYLVPPPRNLTPAGRVPTGPGRLSPGARRSCRARGRPARAAPLTDGAHAPVTVRQVRRSARRVPPRCRPQVQERLRERKHHVARRRHAAARHAAIGIGGVHRLPAGAWTASPFTTAPSASHRRDDVGAEPSHVAAPVVDIEQELPGIRNCRSVGSTACLPAPCPLTPSSPRAARRARSAPGHGSATAAARPRRARWSAGSPASAASPRSCTLPREVSSTRPSPSSPASACQHPQLLTGGEPARQPDPREEPVGRLGEPQHARAAVGPGAAGSGAGLRHARIVFQPPATTRPGAKPRRARAPNAMPDFGGRLTGFDARGYRRHCVTAPGKLVRVQHGRATVSQPRQRAGESGTAPSRRPVKSGRTILKEALRTVIVLLSTSDTDLLSARASGAGYRLGNPARLDAADVPALLDGADVVVVRILGGRRAWEDGLDAVLRLRCARRRARRRAGAGRGAHGAVDGGRPGSSPRRTRTWRTAARRTCGSSPGSCPTRSC